MRARTHAAACDYALSDACTCGVSPAGLSTEQAVRVIALLAAIETGGKAATSMQTIEIAGNYERYIRGEQ